MNRIFSRFHLGAIEQQYAAESLSSSGSSSTRGKKKSRGRGGGAASNSVISKLTHTQCPWYVLFLCHVVFGMSKMYCISHDASRNKR